MIDIKCFRSVEELKTISDDWDTLLAQSSNNTVSLSWDWITNWIKIYLGPDKLLCVAAYDDNKLVGLAPLWVKEIRQIGLFKLRILRFIGSEEICSDHLDFIISKKHLRNISSLIWNHLYGELRKFWDIWEYNNVSSDSIILHIFCQQAVTDYRCLRTEITGYTICPYINLPDSWDDYLASLSSNQRRALKVSTELIEKVGALELSVCTNRSTLHEYMRTHIQLHHKSWEDRGQSGSFKSDQFNAFHYSFAENRLLQNKLLLYSLNLDGIPIGSFYGFEHDQIMYYYLLGVDRSAVPKASIGRVVLGHCIRLAIDRKCREFDLLRGFEEYKYDWTKSERREWLVTFYNCSWPALLLLFRRYCSQYIKHAAQFVFGKHTEKVKQRMIIWRRN